MRQGGGAPGTHLREGQCVVAALCGRIHVGQGGSQGHLRLVQHLCRTRHVADGLATHMWQRHKPFATPKKTFAWLSMSASEGTT